MTTHAFTRVPGVLPGAGYQPRSDPTAEQASPRLAYFITRNNGLPVPLIPADELPFAVKLQGVSRVLNPQDTYGLQYIGTSPYTGATFHLESGSPSAALQRSNKQPPNDPFQAYNQGGTGMRQFLPPDALARQTSANNSPVIGNSPAVASKRPLSASETAKSWRRSDPVDSSDAATQNVIAAILRSEAGAETAERIGYRSRDLTPPPSGITPDQDKKVFCTHWIMTGDCKFVQQGCRYKHEMPTEAKLKELGIRHKPRWWQEQNAAIKLGGARNVLGPALKPMEMLSMGNDEEADDESSSVDSSDEDSENEVPVVEKKYLSPVKKETGNGSKQTFQQEIKSPFMPSTGRLCPTMDKVKDIRKPSAAASDLIDLLSTSSVSTMPSKPSLSNNNTSRTSTSPNTGSVPGTPPSSQQTAKVFVPAGESPEVHIAEMKKRERSTRHKQQHDSSSHVSPSQTCSSVKAVVNGLHASRHALSSSAENSPKRNKIGCRLRRPATMSSPARIGGGVAAIVNSPSSGAEKKG